MLCAIESIPGLLLDILERDEAWARKVNPNGHTLESWMRANNYKGEFESVTKGSEDTQGHDVGLNREVTGSL